MIIARAVAEGARLAGARDIDSDTDRAASMLCAMQVRDQWHPRRGLTPMAQQCTFGIAGQQLQPMEFAPGARGVRVLSHWRSAQPFVRSRLRYRLRPPHPDVWMDAGTAVACNLCLRGSGGTWAWCMSGHEGDYR
jgi:hypothetical protein